MKLYHGSYNCHEDYEDDQTIPEIDSAYEAVLMEKELRERYEVCMISTDEEVLG